MVQFAENLNPNFGQAFVPILVYILEIMWLR